MDTWSRAHIADSDEELLARARSAMENVIPGFSGLLESAHFECWQPAALASRKGMYSDLARLVRLIDPADPIQLAGDYYFGVPSLNAAPPRESRPRRVAAPYFEIQPRGRHDTHESRREPRCDGRVQHVGRQSR